MHENQKIYQTALEKVPRRQIQQYLSGLLWFSRIQVWGMQAKNEELARKAAKASEEDIKTLTDEYEARLGTAERKVYALSKERDMLKRGTEKLSSATETLKEKDNIIAQVLICPPSRVAGCHGTAISSGCDTRECWLPGGG